MLYRLLQKLALMVLGMFCIGLGVWVIGQATWGSYLNLYVEVSGVARVSSSSSTQTPTVGTPHEYLRECLKSDPCARKAIPLVWANLAVHPKRQAVGLLVAGIGTLIFVGLSRRVSKTVERRSFDPTYKRS